MPRYYLLVNDRPVKSSSALDQLKDFAKNTFCSNSVKLTIQEFGSGSYLQPQFHRYDPDTREWVRSFD